jgi:hypothetical protein
MGGKTAITAGLVTGILAGAAVLGGILLLAPAPPPVEASPSPAPPTASPAPASPAPSIAAPSPSTAAPTAAAASSVVSQHAWGASAPSVHSWIDAAGVVRDGALGGIGPDIMAAGLGSILPGVEVTPG